MLDSSNRVLKNSDEPQAVVGLGGFQAITTGMWPDFFISLLNQSQGGIYMGGWLKDGLNSGGEDVGLGLEDGSTATFDFVSPVGQTTEELAYRRCQVNGPKYNLQCGRMPSCLL
jgi:hypothetical protein